MVRSRRSILTLASACALSLGFVLPVPLLVVHAATPAPVQQRVASAFLAVTTGSGSAQISSFKADGTGQVVLTKGPATNYAPSVSPDGKQVLYQGDDGATSGVYRMNIDGTNVIAITKPPLTAGTPTWSADGSKIAFVIQAPNKSYQLMSANPDGGNPVQLTNSTDGSSFTQPVFSPDGASIASTSIVPGTAGSPNAATRISVMNVDGTNARPLSPGPTDAYPAWVNKDTLLFVRSSKQGAGSAVLSLTTAGVEKPQSPPSLFLTEPKPLPDGKSYGATEITAGGLLLVKVSRLDGGPLAAVPGEVTLMAMVEGFDVVELLSKLGDVYSIVWIISVLAIAPVPTAIGGPTGTPTSPPAPVPASPNLLPWGIGLLVLLLLGAGAWRLLRREPKPPPGPQPVPEPTPPPGSTPRPEPIAPSELPPGATIVRKPEPRPNDDEVHCDYNDGYHVYLKHERREPVGLLGSEADAAAAGTLYLRNRINLEIPQTRQWLAEWADGIGCRPPCVKHVVTEQTVEHWDEPRSGEDGTMVTYVRVELGITVECRPAEADGS